MSHRPIATKKRKRVARSFRTKLPTYFDLLQWLQDNGHAASKPEAKRLLLAHRLKYDGETIGTVVLAYQTRDAQVKTEEVHEKFLASHFRSGLTVVDVEA